jgi:hypothetical protein
MADRVRRVSYFYTTVPDQPGEGARVLKALKNAGVNLLAYHAFPSGGKAQLDFFPEQPDKFTAAAKAAGITLSAQKTAFLSEGEDRVGAIHETLETLAKAGINVIAGDAVAAGKGRYGQIFWVAPADVERAAKALGA